MTTTLRIGSSGALVALIVALVLVAFPTPSDAGEVSFAFGAGFAVGGISFQVAWAGPYAGYQPYYYRTAAPLHYPGYGCGAHCFKRRGHWYHGPACGLVLHHFSLYGFYGPAYSLEGVYAPLYGPSPSHYMPFYGRGSHGHHHRNHGYIEYRAYGGYGYGYGYGRSYGYGYGRGYEQRYRGHGNRYGNGHRHGYRPGHPYKPGYGKPGYGYGPGHGRGYQGHKGTVRPPAYSPGRSPAHPPGAARRTRPPQP